MNNEESCIEESRYIESRVELFCTLYVPSGMLEADEYYDDVKLRDFFGCESQQYVKDGLWEYREALLSRGFIEQPCLWLGGKMCFPVKENFVECREVKSERSEEEGEEGEEGEEEEEGEEARGLKRKQEERG